MKTFSALQFDTTNDPISGETLGAFQNPSSIKDGVRAYAASAYHDEDTSNRSNLYLITDTLVEKIIFEKLEDGSTEPGRVRATGVKLSTTSGQCIIHARKEVIIACGTVKSPQLLELSGIGDRDHLSHHGVELVVDNKQVGENLQYVYPYYRLPYLAYIASSLLTSIVVEIIHSRVSALKLRTIRFQAIS